MFDYEFVINLRASLKNAKAEAYLNGPQLLDTLVSKLPLNLNRSWLKYKLREPQVNVDNFIDWLRPSYQCAIQIEMERERSGSSKSPYHVNAHEEMEEDEEQACPCCKRSGHTLSECKKFKRYSPGAKWELVRMGKWCFTCLDEKHFFIDCPNKKACKVDDCAELHHPELHYKKTEVNVHHHDVPHTYFRSLPVKLSKNGKSITVWAFLDEGSGPTLISENVATQLGLSGKKTKMSLKWSDGSAPKCVESTKVCLDIAGVEKDKKFNLYGVQTVPVLDLPMPTSLKKLQEQHKHLSGIRMPEIPLQKPEILIGLQHVRLTVPYKIRVGAWNAPVASRTKLGWSIYGRDFTKANRINDTSCHILECSESIEMRDEKVRKQKPKIKRKFKSQVSNPSKQMSRNSSDSTRAKIDPQVITDAQSNVHQKKNGVKISPKNSLMRTSSATRIVPPDKEIFNKSDRRSNSMMGLPSSGEVPKNASTVKKDEINKIIEPLSPKPREKHHYPIQSKSVSDALKDISSKRISPSMNESGKRPREQVSPIRKTLKKIKMKNNDIASALSSSHGLKRKKEIQEEIFATPAKMFAAHREQEVIQQKISPQSKPTKIIPQRKLSKVHQLSEI